MSYRIIMDSCGELTEEMKADGRFETVPLGLEVDEEYIVDDEHFDQQDFLQKMKHSSGCPKSSCPSPDAYMRHYRCDEERVYVVTLSAELSGSYNSAVLGKTLYEEEYGEKQIHVFNSCSASVGETLIGMKIRECEEAGMDFDRTVACVEAYIKEQQTYFVLESLDNLHKNGRLTGVKALVASALNIKPIMGSTPEGTIRQLDKARGINKALHKMVDEIVKDVIDPAEKILAIAHCNCKERATCVKMMIEEKIRLKKVIILDTRGVSTLYANDGGIIVVV